MKKLHIERELNGHKFLFASPKPSHQPYLLDALELVKSARSTSTRVFGFYALFGLIMREPKLVISAPKPGSDGEVGKSEMLVFGQQVAEELDPMLETLGVTTEDLQGILQELLAAGKE